MKDFFDLVVIGSGPGGLKAAMQAAKLGKNVLLVEKDKVGGASVHTGTIPSKSLREAALQSRTDFSSAMKRMRTVVTAESQVIADQIQRNKVKIMTGTATFLDTDTVQIKGKQKKTIKGKAFIIATGTRPIRHAEFPFHLPNVLDSDSVLKLKKIPKNMLILGAGVIGCEYASIFSRLGSKVVLADRRKELLRTVDSEVIENLRLAFKEQKIDLVMNCALGPVKRASGSAKLEISLNAKKRSFDALLVCMGRTANTEELALPKIGVTVDDRGNIKVDSSYRTSISNVYAVGDVIGAPALAASSAEQGRIAACRIFSVPCNDFPPSFPYGIYTIPEISSVGLQEFDLQQKKIPYVVGRANFSEVARGLILREKNGFMKIIVHAETRKILGVHGIGTGTSELIHIGQAVLALGAPVDYLVDNVFNYPTFAEAYKVAALDAVNQIRKSTTSN